MSLIMSMVLFVTTRSMHLNGFCNSLFKGYGFNLAVRLLLSYGYKLILTLCCYRYSTAELSTLYNFLVHRLGLSFKLTPAIKHHPSLLSVIKF